MKLKDIIETVVFMVVVAAIFLAVKMWVMTPVMVNGHSMDYTLQDQERIFSLLNVKTHRFDIVAFKAPDDPTKNYIKRVIGLPGDEVKYVDDQLYVNGEKLSEPYLDKMKEEVKKITDAPLTPDFDLHEVTYDDVPNSADAQAKGVVPEGYIFVMGDNRQNSKDSRYFGFVPEKHLMNCKWAFWPLDKFGSVGGEKINR
ncbi:MAG: signal peptidase I [Lactobacillales bacterium]|jgi:signal peptidase I|nr:signal peptidase I [Lactobacillales bacterium]